MGEVNLVKQALFANGHEPVPAATIDAWAGFMEALRARRIPLAIHSDLGDDDEPTRYLPLMEDVLRRYPDNPIVWMHMGLSRELTTMDPARHAALMSSLLDRHPNLMLDISWRVLDDAYFSTPAGRAAYVPFLNAYSERILPGTDFLASRDKDFEVYRTELEVTGASTATSTTARSATSPSGRTTSACWIWTTRRHPSAHADRGEGSALPHSRGRASAPAPTHNAPAGRARSDAADRYNRRRSGPPAPGPAGVHRQADP